MKVQPITLEDMLNICYINYKGVKEAVIQIANDSKDIKEFYSKFHEYYKEHGLGGDDCWHLCERYLGLILVKNENEKNVGDV